MTLATLRNEQELLGSADEFLGWASISELVRERCLGPHFDVAPTLPRLEIATRDSEYQDLHELIKFTDQGVEVPRTRLSALDVELQQLGKSAVLDGAGLLSLRRWLTCLCEVRRFLSKHRLQLPRLYARCSIDPRLDEPLEQLDNAIDDHGALLDSASQELYRLRRSTRALRDKVAKKVESVMLSHEQAMQDRFVTIRDDRYVLPVRSDSRGTIEGIVHGASASGATLFIEPLAVVELGNQLAFELAEMAREEYRVRAELSAYMKTHLPALVHSIKAYADVDLLSAKVRLARDLDARVPVLKDSVGDFWLPSCKHPLLVASSKRSPGAVVVPQDLELKAGQVLVISGPNAGGKTIALKSAGLLVRMCQAALPIPAGDGAWVGRFDKVFCDIGDQQSIARELSSFSAHVSAVASMLKHAGPETLCLIDELGGATDPDEGQAFALAVCRAFAKRLVSVVVTTHYESLKTAYHTDESFRTASVWLDDSLRPTFELRYDLPGVSHALDVARRYGIDEDILAQAVTLRGRSLEYETLANALRNEAVRWERRHQDLDQREYRIARLEGDLKEERARQMSRGKKAVDEASLELLTEISALSMRMKQQKKQQSVTSAEAAELVAAAQAAVQRAQTVARPVTEDTGLPVSVAEVGGEVFVPRLSETFVVLETQNDRVRVGKGAIKLWLTLAELRQTKTGPRKKDAGTSPQTPGQVEQPRSDSKLIRTQDNTMDVRGLRAEDALIQLEATVDRWLAEGHDYGFVWHGVGSGALRDAVRKHLSAGHVPIKKWEPSPTGQPGGDSMTLVILA